jgi:general secretion pathway protein D
VIRPALLSLLLIASGCVGNRSDIAAPVLPPQAAASSRARPIEEPPPAPAAAPPVPLRGSVGGTYPGSGTFVRPPPARAEATADSEGGITLNFVNADIREMIREILGEQLHLGYVIDPRVQGPVTVETGSPVPRSAILSTLESVLRTNGVALVEAGGVYRVVPMDDAARAGANANVQLGGSRPGYSVRILPLRFGAAADVARILEPYVAPGGTLQADAARNILIASGTAQDLDSLSRLVGVFDVDWLAGMSYALYPLQAETARNMAAELTEIFGDGAEGPLAGTRIVPLDRLNAILVIANRPERLREAKNWIDRLDTGSDESSPRLYQYYVQNSRAVDVAAVLNELLSGGSVRTAQPQTAPGSTMVELAPRSASQSSPSSANGGIAPGGSGAGGLSTSAGFSQGQPPLSSQRGLGNAARVPSASRGGLSTGGRAPGGGISDADMPQVRVVADEKNNALVIYARPRDYRMIENTIKRLDIVPLQVLIEATIAEVTLNDALRYGLQFFLKQGASRFILTNGSAAVTGGAGITGIFPGFDYVLGGSNAQLILSALSSVTDVNVVSSPQLLVLDHQTATLQVGDQVPVTVQQAQSVLTADAPVVSSIQFRDTGVILQVRPRVNSSGLVTLDIDQEVSDVAPTTTSNINSPTIQQRRISTSVVVQDGETVALGGLIRDSINNGKTGVPILSSIPVLGLLFSTTTKSKSRTELMVLLSPKVVRNPKEARELTDELRNRVRAVQPLESRVQ